MKYISYMYIACYFFSSISVVATAIPFELKELPQETSGKRIAVQQTTDEILNTIDHIDDFTNKLHKDVRTIEKQTRQVKKLAHTQHDQVNALQDTVNNTTKKINLTTKKACKAQDATDDIELKVGTIDNQLPITIGTIQIAKTKGSVLQETSNSILDKMCTIQSVVEEIDDTTNTIHSLTSSLIDLSSDNISILENLDSKSDIIVSKVCGIESILDLAIGSGTESIISTFDVSCSQIGSIQSIADAALDKSCDILSIVENIDSKIDFLDSSILSITDINTTIISVVDTVSSQFDMIESTVESTLDKMCTILSIADQIENPQGTFNSILDKSCAILSITELVDSKVDDIQSIADIIESKVCKVATCDFIIRQADLPFTITNPGFYCLGENVDFTGTAITIGSNDVTLELGSHTMDGNSMTLTTAIRVNSSSNVTIQNGSIQHSSAGIQVDSSDGPIMIQDIAIFDSAPLLGNGIPGEVGGIIFDDSHQALVKNCHCSNITPIGFNARNESSHCTFIRCSTHDMSNAGFVVSEGSSFCIFEHCTACSNSAMQVDGEFINNFNTPFTTHVIIGGPGFGIYGTDCCMQSCKVSEYTFGNIYDDMNIQGVSGAIDVRGERNIIRDCISSENTAHGFAINGTSQCVIRCAAYDNQVFDGFSLGTNQIVVGMTTLSDMPIVSSAIHECIALGNSGDGFVLQPLSSTNNELKGNISTGNTVDGFDTSNVSMDNKLISNLAEENAIGFNNAASTPIFHNNCACRNDTTNYDTVPPLTQQPNDISGFWINADCQSRLPGEFESKICNILTLVEIFTTPA